jgi:hypothetical protein
VASELNRQAGQDIESGKLSDHTRIKQVGRKTYVGAGVQVDGQAESRGQAGK